MSTPYRLWEILQRSYTGPHCDEDDFLPKIFTPKLQQVIEKYGIKYDPKTPVPTDDELSDRVWQAGWELFRDVGLYNTNTHRIIQVSEEKRLILATYHAEGFKPLVYPMMAEGTFPYYISIVIVGDYIVRTYIYTYLATVAFIFIYQYYSILTLIDYLFRAGIHTRWFITVHAGYRQPVHAEIGVYTRRRVRVFTPNRIYPDPGACIQAVLHFAGYPAGLTAKAPIQINNQSISFAHSSSLLGFFNLNLDTLHLPNAPEDSFLSRVDSSVGQLLMTTLSKIPRPPSLVHID